MKTLGLKYKTFLIGWKEICFGWLIVHCKKRLDFVARMAILGSSIAKHTSR
jgi:hypothetical protein